jgi:hypothetical protein
MIIYCPAHCMGMCFPFVMMTMPSSCTYSDMLPHVQTVLCVCETLHLFCMCSSPMGQPRPVLDGSVGDSQVTADYDDVLHEILSRLRSLREDNAYLRAQLADRCTSHTAAAVAMARAVRDAEREVKLLQHRLEESSHDVCPAVLEFNTCNACCVVIAIISIVLCTADTASTCTTTTIVLHARVRCCASVAAA